MKIHISESNYRNQDHIESPFILERGLVVILIIAHQQGQLYNTFKVEKLSLETINEKV